MSVENYKRALARELVYEGGKVDDKRDPGGRTNQGVTQATFNTWMRRHGYKPRDVYTMVPQERDALYKELYWDRVAGDKLPPGVDLVVLDAAINSGVGQAGKWMQRALKGYTGQMDGDFGPKTIQAILDDEDNDALIARFLAQRLGTLQRLTTWKIYGNGWHARISNVQKIGQAWASGSVGPNPVNVEAISGHRKAIVPDNVVKPFISVATANVATASSVVSTGVTQATTMLQPVQDAVGDLKWVKIGFAGLTVLAAVAGVVAMVSTKASEAAAAGTRTATVNPDADQLGLPTPVNDDPPPDEQKVA